MAQAKKKSTAKRDKTNYTSGIVNIQSTFNNTIKVLDINSLQNTYNDKNDPNENINIF